jgi:sortase A
MTSAPEPDAPLDEPRSTSGTSVTRAAALAGKVLIGLGLLLLAFVAFEILGTSYLQGRHQAALRGQIGDTAAAARLAAPEHEVVGPPTTVAPTTPPPAGSPVAVIAIPKISLNQVVVEGTGEAQLELGPGHYVGTPLPGEAGNVGIAGHRTTWGRPFYNLDQLSQGDPIYLATSRGTFIYRVLWSRVVAPTDVSVLDPTPTNSLTLTTCNPRYSAAQRLVVRAQLSGTIEILRLHPSPPSTSRAAPSAPAQPGLLETIALGLLVALLLVGAWLGARRLSRPWLAYLIAAPFVAVSLFFFFVALSAHLPAGY